MYSLLYYSTTNILWCFLLMHVYISFENFLLKLRKIKVAVPSSQNNKIKYFGMPKMLLRNSRRLRNRIEIESKWMTQSMRTNECKMDEAWNICYKGHVTCLTYHSIQATVELPCICHILPVSVTEGCNISVYFQILLSRNGRKSSRESLFL